MKISNQFALREIAGNYIIVPFGENTVSFNSMITLNETGAFLWKLLENQSTKDELLSRMLEEYEIDEATASQHIDNFITKLIEVGIIKNES